MEVKDWGGGLNQREVDAIKKIKEIFKSEDPLESLNDHQSSKPISLAALQKSMPSNAMFPWKGYSGFRLINPSNNKEGEFDLIIITHCNVLIIELKDWNYHKVTSKGNRWYLGDKDMGRSPVSITQDKVFLIKNILDKYKGQFTNKGFIPRVEFFVVMTGNADFKELHGADHKHTISLDDFLKFRDERVFNEYFRPHPESKVLNKDFEIFDNIFGGSNVRPKNIRVNGYVAEEDPEFIHPNEIYSEYLAYSEYSTSDRALMRRWDFSKIDSSEAQTPEGRFKLVSREYEVLQFLKGVNEDLYQNCLKYKTVPQLTDMTVDHTDLFELMPSHQRFNQFIGQVSKQLSKKDRIDYVKLLISKFSELHKVDIAHRDIGSHSIWISADKKISLSGFVTAFFPKKGTIGNTRDILTVSSDLLNSLFPNEAEITAYQQDVRALALLSWHILKAERLSKISITSFQDKLHQDGEWYSHIIKQAFSEHKFSNAREFLEAFNSSSPKDIKDFSFDISKLEPYYNNISHYREFREDDDYIVEDDQKEVYLSNGRLVKAWLNVYPPKGEPEARTLFHWLEQVSHLQQVAPSYLPRIELFGVATKSSSLYVVSEFIKGCSWFEVEEILGDKFKLEHKLYLINSLIKAVEHLHGLDIAHGDIHPDNIRIDVSENAEVKLFLLDVLDFNIDGKQNLNYQYSPPQAENVSAKRRDNYAVMKLCAELLGLEWNKDSSEFPEISKSIQTELSDSKSGFVSLERFKESIKPKKKIQMVEIKLDNRSISDLIQILPDNDELFIGLEEQKRSKDVQVNFYGLGGIFRAIYSVKDKSFSWAFRPLIRDRVAFQDKDKSVLSLPLGLTIKKADYNDLTELNGLLVEYDVFQEAIFDFIEVLNADSLNSSDDSPTSTVKDIIKESSQTRVPVKKLWQAILETETEALPTVAASGETVFLDEDKAYVPSEGETSPLDQFNRDDIVEALGIDLKNDRKFIYGKVDIKRSSLNELFFLPGSTRRSVNDITSDSLIYLQSKQDKVSFNRRHSALSRILDGESVINNLYDYFDESCKLSATKYSIDITDKDFERYDRVVGSKVISLNEAQKEAFRRIAQNGPISLLQGPPGTGKTEFIAAFVHFLFEKQNVRNILLVSQSHQAVNTAAERIRRHCRRLDTDLEVVRFSNRQSTISNELQDVFSQNIQSSKYEMLKLEKIERIKKLGLVLGLEESYLHKKSEIYFEVGKQVERYKLFLKNSGKKLKERESEDRLLSTIEQDIRTKVESIALLNDFEIKNLAIEDLYSKLNEILDNGFSVSPKESQEADSLIKLTQDMMEALSNERTNYDEFLARSRQLVVGTCVGMGQSHIGISSIIYDWVIIDEAARSISSELAIAMQSGKRILLVGDHKQLPPLYSKEHKLALARRLGISKRDEELDLALGSDFERVFQSDYGQQTCATLKVQYRMAPAIGSLISTCFYDGELENGKTEEDVPNIYSTVPEEIKSNVSWLDTTNLKYSEHLKGKNNSLSNRAEADVVIKLLKDLEENEELMDSYLVHDCLKDGEHLIGIICMYSEQKRLLQKKFNENTWDERFRRLVKIDSVDSYQGEENRIIILSITRYDKSLSPGFLYLPNRINVALSRAMDKLVIVGAKKVWESSKNLAMPLGKVLTYIKNKQLDNSEECRILELPLIQRGES